MGCEACQEGRRQESREEESEEGEQGEGCNEGEEDKGEEGRSEEGGSEKGGSEEGTCEGCTAGKGCIGSKESDGAAEARGSGRTARNAGAGSHAEQRFRIRVAATVDQHGSFRLNGDRRVSVARIDRGGMRAALPSVLTTPPMI
jgi:hypothetical protein